MGFITKQGLVALDNYQYKSGGYSPLDNVLNYYWEAVVKLVPLWVAPNLLTFTGLCFMLSSFGVMLIYDASLSKNLPSWTFYWAGFAQFMYQTLDAIDGKQARRTKASSPLGQLFDHGCDAFSTTFIVLTVAQCLKIGDDWNIIIFAATLQLVFFVSTWTEYHTHVLHTKMGAFGVTEAELTIISVLIFTGVMGQDIYHTPVNKILPFLGGINIPLVKIILWSVYGVGAIGVGTMVIVCLNHKDVKITALIHFVPVFICVIGAWIWKHTDIYDKYPAYYMLTYGVVFSIVIAKMIVCALTKMTFPLVHLDSLYMIVAGLAFQVLEKSLNPTITSLLFFAYVASIWVVEVMWCHDVIQEITNHLGIWCFKVGKREKGTETPKKD